MRHHRTVSRVRQRQAAFLLKYLLDRSRGSNPETGDFLSYSTDIATTHDDGTNLCADFRVAFPGRKPDPNHDLAHRQLSVLSKLLWEDGYLDRWIVGNEKYVPNEPSWQYVYRLPQDLINDFKRGRETPEGVAMAWGGHVIKST